MAITLTPNMLVAWNSYKERGGTQCSLAKIAGTSQPFISRVLSGHERPNHNFVNALACVSGKSPLELDPNFHAPRSLIEDDPSSSGIDQFHFSSVKRPHYGFLFKDLTGALAHLCLKDLRINNFTFHGFPEIYGVSEPVLGKTDEFVFELRAKGQKAELTLNIQCARKIAKEYGKRGAVEDEEAMGAVQQALINLEIAVSQ